MDDFHVQPRAFKQAGLLDSFATRPEAGGKKKGQNIFDWNEPCDLAVAGGGLQAALLSSEP